MRKPAGAEPDEEFFHLPDEPFSAGLSGAAPPGAFFHLPGEPFSAAPDGAFFRLRDEPFLAAPDGAFFHLPDEPAGAAPDEEFFHLPGEPAGAAPVAAFLLPRSGKKTVPEVRVLPGHVPEKKRSRPLQVSVFAGQRSGKQASKPPLRPELLLPRTDNSYSVLSKAVQKYRFLYPFFILK